MTPSHNPVPVVPDSMRVVAIGDVDRFKRALETFTSPLEDQLEKRTDNSIRQHPCPDVEGYFEWVSRHGKPALSWDIIRPAFLWKIKFVMDEMIRIEKERLGEEAESELDMSDSSELKQTYNFILSKAEEFEGAPFTWQRICELLHTPSRHYKRPVKFMRAMDKTINVVTTITEDGKRVTGAEWLTPMETTNGNIEQQFFGKVDEVDGEEFWDPNFKVETARPPIIGPVMGGGDSSNVPEPLNMSAKVDVKAEQEGPSNDNEEEAMDEGGTGGEVEMKEEEPAGLDSDDGTLNGGKQKVENDLSGDSDVSLATVSSDEGTAPPEVESAVDNDDAMES